MWEYTYTDELRHYGRKGMKWGQNIFSKIKNKRIQKNRDKEKRAMVEDAEYVSNRMKAKLSSSQLSIPKGSHQTVYGRYSKRAGIGSPEWNHAIHILDDKGDVKLSYFRGIYGDRYLAAGKDYVDKYIDLNKHFRFTKDMNIEYDVYGDKNKPKRNRKK